jgi:hypothetical protein
MNLFRALRQLLPDAPLQVAMVTSIDTVAKTSTITWPGGNVQTVRGISVEVGNNAFIRDGRVESAAPTLTLETIEI